MRGNGWSQPDITVRRTLSSSLLTITLVLMSPHLAVAGPGDRLVDFLVAPGKESRLALSGIGGGGDSLFAYMGVIQALDGSINDTGPLVRLWANLYEFDYATSIAGRPARIDATGFGGTLEAGYQWTWLGIGRIAGYIGVRFRDHVLTPDDPNSDLDSADAGLILGIDGGLNITGNIRLAGSYSYTVGFDEYWLQSRAGYRLPNFRIGPELVLFGGENYEYQRYGAFISDIVLDFAPDHRLFLSIEAGAQRDVDERDITPYGGLHASFFF